VGVEGNSQHGCAMTSAVIQRNTAPGLLLSAAHVIRSDRLPQRRSAMHALRATSQFHAVLALFLSLYLFCPNIAASSSDRFCDPLLSAHLSIDQRRSHCLDTSWQPPPSSLVTLYFTVSRCTPAAIHAPAASVSQIGGYAVLSDGIFLLKRFRAFGAGDFDVALNDSFVLPRHLVERALPIPLEVLLIDSEDGISSR
jgi:hypothetical protein